MSLPNVVNQAPPGTKPADLAKRIDRADDMAKLLAMHGVTGWQREHAFHPTRRWRFDIAFPDAKVAVEIDGLRYDNLAGHQTVAGVIADCEKYEAALLAGWTVYRVPAPWLDDRPSQVIDAVVSMLRYAARRLPPRESPAAAPS